MEDHRITELRRALAQIRPYLQGDGGDMELVSLSHDGVVSLRLVGNCNGCGSAEHTLHAVVESVLKAQLPWVVGVEEVPAEALGDDVPRAMGIQPPSCLAALGDDHEDANSRMAELERDLLELAPGGTLPATVDAWIRYARGPLRRHFELEESCVFPAFAMLYGEGGPLATLVADHREFFLRLAAFEAAVTNCKHGTDPASIGTLLTTSHAMLRQLTAHFLREDGGLFALLEEGLPAELMRELGSDITNHRRRMVAEYAA